MMCCDNDRGLKSGPSSAGPTLPARSCCVFTVELYQCDEAMLMDSQHQMLKLVMIFRQYQAISIPQ